MTLAELRAIIVLNTNRSDKVDLIDKTLNLGISEINQQCSFSWLRKTQELAVSASVDGTSMIGLPDDFKSLIEVRLRLPDSNSPTTNIVCVYSKVDLVKLYPNEQSTILGRPQTAYQEMRSLKLLPPAGQDYILIITYNALHPDLIEDSDTTLSTVIDNALISFATSYIYRSITMFQDAGAWKQEYLMALETAARSDSRKPAVIRQMAGARDNVSGYSGNPYENIYTKT